MTWQWCIFLSILTVCLTIIWLNYGSDLYLIKRYQREILKEIDKMKRCENDSMES